VWASLYGSDEKDASPAGGLVKREKRKEKSEKYKPANLLLFFTLHSSLFTLAIYRRFGGDEGQPDTPTHDSSALYHLLLRQIERESLNQMYRNHATWLQRAEKI
jgi:hypothetical protein